MQLKVKKLNPTIPLPSYSRKGDAALDIRADIVEPLTLAPNARIKIASGVAVAIPAGHVGLMFPRGGMGSKGLNLMNTTGVVDANYRGEIFIPLINNGLEPLTIQPQERIMQLVILPIATCTVEEVTELDETNRGEGRFGSSGTA